MGKLWTVFPPVGEKQGNDGSSSWRWDTTPTPAARQIVSYTCSLLRQRQVQPPVFAVLWIKNDFIQNPDPVTNFWSFGSGSDSRIGSGFDPYYLIIFGNYFLKTP